MWWQADCCVFSLNVIILSGCECLQRRFKFGMIRVESSVWLPQYVLNGITQFEFKNLNCIFTVLVTLQHVNIKYENNNTQISSYLINLAILSDDLSLPNDEFENLCSECELEGYVSNRNIEDALLFTKLKSTQKTNIMVHGLHVLLDNSIWHKIEF